MTIRSRQKAPSVLKPVQARAPGLSQLAASTMLVLCGSAIGDMRIGRDDIDADAARGHGRAATVVSLTPVAQRLLGTSGLREVDYQVTLEVGPVPQANLRFRFSSRSRDLRVLDGKVDVGDVPAGATLKPGDTITLRQPVSQALDVDALQWTVRGRPVRRIVRFNPSRCESQDGAPGMQTVGVTGTNMMVASADINASAAGCRVLARGGAAADAAIAMQAVLAVAEPFGSGLAGGTTITYFDADKRAVHTYDGLAAAPAHIGDPNTTQVFQAAVDADLACRPGRTIGSSLSVVQGNTNASGRATGVPGTLKVLDMVHDQFGRKPWRSLWHDAIDLAEHGFPMTRYMYSTLYSEGGSDEDTGAPVPPGPVRAWTTSTRWGAARCQYKDIQALYCDPTDPAGEKPLPVGTLIRNPELAQTLARVRDGGADEFYNPKGPIVSAILQRFREDAVKPDGSNNCYSDLPTYDVANRTTSSPIIPARIPSLMTAEDFAEYRAVERPPLVGSHFGLTIYTQPAPLFGGLVTLYSLGLLERTGLTQFAWGSEDFYYRVIEASRMSNADRRNIVGDPAYSNVNERLAVLLSPAYLDQRASLINGTAQTSVSFGGAAEGIPPFVPTDPTGYDAMAALSKPIADGAVTRVTQASDTRRHDEDWNTTSSLAIVDGYGNALAMTTTINSHWGAHIQAAGMMLNNVMSNFSTSVGTGGDVNGYQPRKRARSSIAPSIALDDTGRVRLVWGAAGGGPIPDYIVKTFLGSQVYKMELQAALNAANWSGQSTASSVGTIEVETAAASLVDSMRVRFGYTDITLNASGLAGGLAAISVDYDRFGFPAYTGAADARRAGAANGY